MRSKRRSRTACDTAVGGKKKARCVQEEEEEGRSPGGSTSPWGTPRRKEYLELLIKGIAVVGHALIGLALLIELALYMMRML
jgi:hypothetical protein